MTAAPNPATGHDEDIAVLMHRLGTDAKAAAGALSTTPGAAKDRASC